MTLKIRVVAFWVKTLCIYLWHINAQLSKPPNYTEPNSEMTN
jgi:hypothetical protein